jgi:endoglucanase
MSASVFDTLAELMTIPAPTGQEEPVLAWCRERWASLGAEVETQPIGNVLARIPGNGPRLLIQGHADEIGFVVKSIDERGFVRLADGQAGSRKPQSRFPVGHPALVLGRNGAVDGVFAAPSGHIMVTLGEAGALTEHDLFVDLGVESRHEAEMLGIHVGAGVIWNPPVRRLGTHRYVGKAIDNRVALALATHLLAEADRSTLHYDITVAATVQEEIGLVGAMSLANRGEYDLAIAIDNGPIADYPGVSQAEMPITLGAGPSLVYKDSWTHYDRRIINQLREVAAANNIPVQETIFPGFGSDGAALIRSGIPAALLGIATRYTHAPFEMGDTRDLDAALALLIAFVTRPATALPLGPS